MPQYIDKINLPGGREYDMRDSISEMKDVSISGLASGQALVYNGTNWINDYISGSGSGGGVSIIQKRYSELKSMYDNETLSPGQLYRITDYVTTSVQQNTSSARHPFDLIVLAINTNELDCRAIAIEHPISDQRDPNYQYFSNADLSKWQIWYDINNDTTKYNWADTTNGKGVIYRMIDEWNNDCSYDFKNIMFTVSNYSNIYTFTILRNGNTYDASVNSVNADHTYKNIINPWYRSDILTLNFIVFIDSADHGFRNNFFENDCNNNIINGNCSNNTFGQWCSNIVLGEGCENNTFGHTCLNIVLGSHFISNTFGNNCSYITFGNSSTPSTGGTYCRYNIIESGNRYIRIYQTSNEGYGNYLQNIYIAQGTNSTTTEYVVSSVARNLPYRTTIAMNKAGTGRIIYCEDEISDMLPSMSGNANKVLAVNSNADGLVWVANSGGGGSSTLSGLTDTAINNVTSNDVLIYNNGYWRNSRIRATGLTKENVVVKINSSIPRIMLSEHVDSSTDIYDYYVEIDGTGDPSTIIIDALARECINLYIKNTNTSNSQGVNLTFTFDGSYTNYTIYDDGNIRYDSREIIINIPRNKVIEMSIKEYIDTNDESIIAFAYSDPLTIQAL